VVTLRKTVAGLTEIALARFLGRATRAVGLRGTVNVVITTSRELRSLNRRFRGKDQPTDVLSFPAAAHLPLKYAGDLAISAELASQNGRKLGHTASEEVKILILHGVLHLAGYDNERDKGAVARKAGRQTRGLHVCWGVRRRRPERCIEA